MISIIRSEFPQFDSDQLLHVFGNRTRFFHFHARRRRRRATILTTSLNPKEYESREYASYQKRCVLCLLRFNQLVLIGFSLYFLWLPFFRFDSTCVWICRNGELQRRVIVGQRMTVRSVASRLKRVSGKLQRRRRRVCSGRAVRIIFFITCFILLCKISADVFHLFFFLMEFRNTKRSWNPE
jgi:hypothetical protein